MKTILTSILTVVLAFPIGAFAQEEAVQLSMAMFYQDQVFYSLDNGLVAATDNETWDIAFSTYGQGAAGSAILLNEARSIVFEAPYDTTEWLSFDTTGIQSWVTPLNSDTSWSNGAFNSKRGLESNFDMGWGLLNPTNNFWTFGDSLYVIGLGNGEYKKLWIHSLRSGLWEFRYADLNGSNEVSVEIEKTDHPNRNFIYYSLENGALVDREPDNTTWDLTFAKHADYYPGAGFVSVTNAFNNRNVWSAKAHTATHQDALDAQVPETEFNQNISNIGREWKHYSSSTGWTVFDTTAYFIFDEDSTDFYRLVFTGFGGMGTGTVDFTQLKLGTVSIEESSTTEMTLSIYPNPATDNFTLLMQNKESQDLTLTMLDMQGRLVKNETWKQGIGIHQRNFSVSDLPAGMYLLRVDGKDLKASTQMIVR